MSIDKNLWNELLGQFKGIESVGLSGADFTDVSAYSDGVWIKAHIVAMHDDYIRTNLVAATCMKDFFFKEGFRESVEGWDLGLGTPLELIEYADDLKYAVLRSQVEEGKFFSVKIDDRTISLEKKEKGVGPADFSLTASMLKKFLSQVLNGVKVIDPKQDPIKQRLDRFVSRMP